MTTCAGILAGACAVLPEPLSEAAVATAGASNLQRVTAGQDPILRPVTLYEAMARALKYNLDHRVNEAEAAVALAELNVASYAMLPNLVGSSGYAMRDKWAASSSYNVVKQQENFDASTSQDRAGETADIGFSWNILDFGLSYVRARQSADKYLIREETRRKALQRIAEDVRTSFWRATSAERLLKEFSALDKAAAEALKQTQIQYSGRMTSPIEALRSQRELLEIRQKMEELSSALATSKTQLAALMNVAPGTPFQIALQPDKVPPTPIALVPADMISIAVVNRQELREAEYKKRINLLEAQSALLELLPGLQLYSGANYDTNSFLLSHDWINWGAKVSWNLMKVFAYPARARTIAEEDKALDAQTLAMTMAIMTQVYVSRIRYANADREFKTAAKYREVQRLILKQSAAETSAGRTGQHALLRERMSTLIAEVKYDLAYAQLQNAYANLFSSMGLDPYPSGIDNSKSVARLAVYIEEVWQGNTGKLQSLAKRGAAQ